MTKVIAVVVTYNRQMLLSKCINALRSQTVKIDKILVVNNGSTDNTSGWLKTQSDIDFINQENAGSAGGFYTAIKKGYEDGFTWIWLMDDDGYPKSNALQLLLEEEDAELSLKNCAVININDKKSFVWRTRKFKTLDDVDTRVIKNIAHPFNGTLLHRKIVEKAGLPDPRLFLWGDETDYYYRIVRKHKIPFYTVKDSIHYHPATSFNIKNDYDYFSGWKMYYYIRNRYHVLKSKFSAYPVLSNFLYVGFLLVFSATVLVYQKTHKLRKLTFIFWPAMDAFKARFNQTPSSILQKLDQHHNIPAGNVSKIYLSLLQR